MSLSLDRPLLLVGAGKMGSALLSGWLADGLSPGSVMVRDPSPSPDMKMLVAEAGIAINFPIEQIAARNPSVVVVAVKPQMMASVLPELKPLAGPDTLFLSIAAGTTLDVFSGLLGPDARIVRSMPNTPASVGRGITVACAGPRVSDAQKALAEQLLGAVGEVGWVEDEALIDAVTAISGSGPAYVFYLVECLAAGGEALGLAPALAMQLARATVSGAGEMLHRSGEPAATLRKNVTSPGGTTAAALEVLMGEEAMASLLLRAVTAARDRSRDLARPGA
ncbi:MAG: pyrroline-5-carboxylate reductase [Parvibaculaceae bacterium]|nr:pyrroline-5-carboxylate reductase [Parvibaculaceae bacterium]